MLKKKNPLANIGAMAALTISSKLVRLVILMITARFLTPEDFGVVAAFTMIFGFAYLLSEMGIVRTIIQRPLINDKHIGSALALSIGLSIVVCFILLLFSDFIADSLTIQEIALPLKVSCSIFLLLGVSNICSALLQRNGEIVFIGKVQALGTITGNLFVTVPLLYFDIGYWSIIIGLWVSELISVSFILYKNHRALRYKAYKKELSEIVKYATAFFFNNTLGMLSQQVDIAIVSRFIGGAALGNYSRAMQLVEFPNQIYWLVVDRVVFPLMSAMKSEKEKLIEFFLQSLALLSLLLTIGTFVLVIGAQQVVTMVMGADWGVVGNLLQILAGCIMFRASASFMDSFLAAYNLVKILTFKEVSSLFILLLSLWCGLDYGIAGVAYAVVVASLFRFSLTLVLILIYTKVTCVELVKAFSPSICSLLFISLVYFLILQTPVLEGLLGALIAFALYVAFSIIFPMKVMISDTGVNFITQLKAKYLTRFVYISAEG